MKLDCNQIQDWKDLVKALLFQFDHVVDTALDRISLMTMKNKGTKFFNEYAQRWHDLAF